jgi:LEA14-like dessication related protein
MHRPLFILAALTLTGCEKIGSLEGLGLDQFLPKVVFKRLKVGAIDFQKIDTDFVFAIENPNPIKVKLSSFSYDLDLAGSGLIEGVQNDGLTLEAQGDSKLVFPVRVVWADLFKLVGDLKGKDAVPFSFRGSIGFNTPLGEIKIPFKDTGEFPVIHLPKFSFQGVRVGKLDLLKQSATVTVDLGVQHDGGSPLALTGFDYNLTFGGKKVIEGVIDELASAKPGESGTISLPVTLNLLQLGATIVEAITQKTKLDVGLDATLAVGTPFGVVPLSIDERGKVDVK